MRRQQVTKSSGQDGVVQTVQTEPKLFCPIDISYLLFLNPTPFSL